jgi:thymidylate synthase
VEELRFEALYYADKLDVVNPAGDIGIVTLWSPLPAARRRLATILPGGLDPARSRIAVLSNLYGDGMHAMLCNLLFNPQIRYLIAVGQDLGLPTARELEMFLELGLEDVTMFGKQLKRIRQTDRFFPAAEGFDEARLQNSISFRAFGNLADPSVRRDLPNYLHSLPPAQQSPHPERIRVAMTEFDSQGYSFRPSQVEAHEVVRRRPLDCWEELVARGIRFGRPVALRSGPRLELLNTKVVVTNPAREAPEELAKYGFDLDRFLAYQKRILEPEIPDGITYTYGNRLRGYFPQGASTRDALDTVIHAFHDDLETRRGYISLWDTTHDLPPVDKGSDSSVPCLTTMFFRHVDGKLSLSATYRSHNLLTAWLENVYGLMAVQQHVAEAVGIPVGPITVVSHSLGIDPRSPRYELARVIAENWRRDEDVDRATGRHFLREDPNGYFIVSVDEIEDCLVVEHRFNGLLVKRYKSDRAAIIEREIIGDMGVSLVSHALWLGRELAINEQSLREWRTGHESSRRVERIEREP